MPRRSSETSNGGRGPRLLAPFLVALLLLALIAAAMWMRWEPRPSAPDVAAPPPAPSEPAPTPAAPSTQPAPPPGDPGASLAPQPDPAGQPPDPDEVALRWALVDLDEVKAAMPDNLYWKMSAPTKDPELIRWREEERARWNREYGKVLSGTATEQEVVDYYAQREQLSLDSIQFASYLLDHYRKALPERDVGLLELAIRLHHARLEELPRRLAEGLARQQEQAAAREAWLRDQAAFGSDGSAQP